MDCREEAQEELKERRIVVVRDLVGNGGKSLRWLWDKRVGWHLWVARAIL